MKANENAGYFISTSEYSVNRLDKIYNLTNRYDIMF